MQIKVCLHFLRTAKKNLEHSLKLGHDYTILHSYQLITHWSATVYRVGQTSVVRFVKRTSKYVAISFYYWLFNKELVKLRHRFTN